MRALVDWSVDVEAGPLGWQLVTTTLPFYQRNGLFRDWLAVASSGLKATERAGDQAGQAHMHRCLAGALYHLGDHGQARDHL
ncbi:hypothetical protein [Micromonospora zamorensis]|uniref:hypothetical protein n=1 Tax=Micromonospora zamorensis TaxID=709883 RepID=UPI003CF944C3